MHRQDLTAARVWSREEKEILVINVEMKVAHLALSAFLSWILGKSVILMSNNATVVAYFEKQEDIVSKVICSLAKDIIGWLELHSVTARYILDKNILVDQFIIIISQTANPN